MTNSNHGGGPIEYVAVALLVLQFLLARRYLRIVRRKMSGAAFAALLTALVPLWVVTVAALGLNFSGTIYTSNAIPTGPRTTIVAVGYLWIVLSSIGGVIAMICGYLASRIQALHSPVRRRWLGAAGVAALGVPAVAGTIGFLSRNSYRIHELDFPVSGLHPDLEGFRIAQVSDVHVSPFLSAREAGRVIDMANELRPDLAVFTGDLISELGDPLDDAIRELIRLRAGEGVLGCMGNHEQYVSCRSYLERRAGQAGVLFLRNKTAQIRRGKGILNVAGVDYERKGDPRGYLPGAEQMVVEGASNILLSHNPDVFPVAIERGFQAVLSGHTHGGQVNVEILHHNVNPARFRTPFTSGLYRQRGGSCFVTTGIGTIGIPVRLGAQPEIALLRLRRI